jgi:hypothetical protein
LDITSDQLDVGMLSTDEQIRTAVAQHFDVPRTKLNNYAIDRNDETGDITLRPQAVFG